MSYPPAGVIRHIEALKLIRVTRTIVGPTSPSRHSEHLLVHSATLVIAAIRFTFSSIPTPQIVSRTLRLLRLSTDWLKIALVNSAQNIRNRLRQRRSQRQNGGSRPADEDDLGTDEEDNDPFGGNSDDDADYHPGADIDEDEDDELEFDSQRVEADDYDLYPLAKAEDYD